MSAIPDHCHFCGADRDPEDLVEHKFSSDPEPDFVCQDCYNLYFNIREKMTRTLWEIITVKDKTKTAKQIVDKITTTLDWYHQQDWEDSPGWRESFWTGLDLLERCLDLPERSLALDHDKKCDCERKVL